MRSNENCNRLYTFQRCNDEAARLRIGLFRVFAVSGVVPAGR
jgi:hypothetical protein